MTRDEQILACSRNVEGATRKFGNHPAIDDLRQAVWLRIITRISAFDPGRANLSTFANWNAQGAMGDFWRSWFNVHNRVHYPEVPFAEIPPAELKQAGSQEDSENSATIDILIAKSSLTPKEMVVVRLMLLDHTMPEIAERTGFKLKTAGYYAKSAIRKMRLAASGQVTPKRRSVGMKTLLGLTLLAASAFGQVATDDFTGTDGTPLAAHNTCWRMPIGSLTIQGNAAHPETASNNSFASWDAGCSLFPPNQFAEGLVSAPGSASTYVGVCVRCGSTVLSGYVWMGTSTFSLLRYYQSTTVFTNLWTGPPFAAGNKIRLEITGTSLTLKKDGLTLVVIEDARIPVGQPGVFGYGNNATSALDDFSAGALVAEPLEPDPNPAPPIEPPQTPPPAEGTVKVVTVTSGTLQCVFLKPVPTNILAVCTISGVVAMTMIVSPPSNPMSGEVRTFASGGNIITADIRQPEPGLYTYALTSGSETRVEGIF